MKGQGDSWMTLKLQSVSSPEWTECSAPCYCSTWMLQMSEDAVTAFTTCLNQEIDLFRPTLVCRGADTYTEILLIKLQQYADVTTHTVSVDDHVTSWCVTDF